MKRNCQRLILLAMVILLSACERTDSQQTPTIDPPTLTSLQVKQLAIIRVLFKGYSGPMDVCVWDRVECDDQGRITKLHALELGLVSLGPEIGQLSSLEMLDLVKNKLTTLPAEIGQLQNLRELHLVVSHTEYDG